MASQTKNTVIALVALTTLGVVTWFAIQVLDDSGAAHTPIARIGDDAEDDGPATPLAPTPQDAEDEAEELVATPDVEREVVDVAVAVDGAGAPAGRVRVAGRLRLPAGTPTFERAVVYALAESHSYRDLYDGFDTPARRARGLEPDEGGELLAASPVAQDGSFAIEVERPTSGLVHLAVTGRFVYSRQSWPVRVTEDLDGFEIGAELGCWISGWTLPPEGEGETLTQRTEVALCPDLTAGFSPMGLAATAAKREVVVDADGWFEFGGVPVEQVYALLAKPETWAAETHLGVEAEPGEHVEVELALSRGGRIAGTVLDASGAPVAGAEVEFELDGLQGDVFEELGEVDVADDGTFEILGVPDDVVILRAEAPDHRPRTKRLDPIADGESLTGVAIVLDQGSWIHGTVSFPDGAPAADVWVHASPDIASSGGAGMGTVGVPESNGASSDEEGNFAIPGLSEATYVLTARTDEEPNALLELVTELGPPSEDEPAPATNWRARMSGVQAGGAPVDLVLEKLATLTVRVTDVDGDPIPEYRVWATLQGSGGMFGIGADRSSYTATDALDGTLDIDRLTGGKWDLFVSAKGYGDSDVFVAEVPEMVGGPPIEVRLLPASSVSGTVVDANGVPVAGARVTLEHDLASMMERMMRGESRSAPTDPEGAFLMDDLDPGSVSLIAEAEGHATSAPVALELIPGETENGVVLQLRKGGVVIAEVLSPEGDPVEGQMVMIQSMPTFTRNDMRTTNAEGIARFESVAPGKWQVIAMEASFLNAPESDEPSGDAMADLLGNMKLEVIEVDDGAEVRVVLGARPENPVQLFGVVEADGEPLEGAMVSLVSEEGTGMSGLSMKFTDEAGRFEIELDQAGAYLVTVQTDVSMGMQNSVEFLEVIPEETERFDLRLEMPAGRISGTVRDAEGKPLPSCRISLSAEGGVAYGSFVGGNYAEVTTDKDGNYDLRHLRPGKYTVAAGGSALGGMFGSDSRGGRSLSGGLTVGAGQWLQGIDFELGPAGALAGTVRGPDGQPVSGATIFVRNADGQLVDRFSMVTSDGAGRFRVEGLSPGNYRPSAETDDGLVGEGQLVTVSSEGEASATIAISEGTILRVVVVDKQEEEIRARVSVVDEEGREYSGMMSMASILENFGDGFSSREQRVGPLPPGRYVVTATADDGRESIKPVELEAQAERRVKLRLR